ncbi:hypothetical protein PBT90_20100 [Algoriphagus halophytocola]|uniref:hypothetical protein n=1 Tax=Algoriphagus halophytocola TaxID=2991499 RepID=UPI0022DD6336|nr:hypothetical protein [Algoriphagus sp. TR-M9]WBL43031.1 hypothetical protein PBT90_20100 [Algoriphagus sp. TR-M9]
MEYLETMDNVENVGKTPSIMRVCTGYHAGIMRGAREKSRFSLAVFSRSRAALK